VADSLDQAPLPYTVIDVHPDRVQERPGAVLGRGTEAHSLMEAGIKDAVGIVAATGDDIDNLSIVMTAKNLNPRLFVVARQERKENDDLFDASGADLVARRSLIVARRILLMATTPLLPVFLQHLLSQGEDFAQRVAARLQSILRGRAPAIWTAHLVTDMAKGIEEARQIGVNIQLRHVLQHSRSEDDYHLPCVCLLLERGASRIFLPNPAQELHAGDRLLFAGREEARREIAWSLSEPYALIANATGRIMPRGSLWRWLRRRSKSA
jgi:hypothetical protein